MATSEKFTDDEIIPMLQSVGMELEKKSEGYFPAYDLIMTHETKPFTFELKLDMPNNQGKGRETLYIELPLIEKSFADIFLYSFLESDGSSVSYLLSWKDFRNLIVKQIQMSHLTVRFHTQHTWVSFPRANVNLVSRRFVIDSNVPPDIVAFEKFILSL